MTIKKPNGHNKRKIRLNLMETISRGLAKTIFVPYLE